MKTLLLPALLLLALNTMNAQEKETTNETSLETVVIKKQKKIIERKVDRLIYNVENSTASTGGNALDALKSAPMVRVQNEAISIVGKGEVLIMIDDRLQKIPASEVAAFLKTIPSDNIKSIEVITSPPAKYEAEGNNGIINIKLKTAKSNSWNASVGTNYTQRFYAGNGVQGMFNYNHGKLSLQSSVYVEQQKFRSNSQTNTYYQNELWSMDTQSISKNKNLGISLGADYKITDQWTTGVKYLGSFSTENGSSSPLTSRMNYQNSQPNSFISSDTESSNKPNINSLNWFNTIKMDSAKTVLTTDFDFFEYKKDDARDFYGSELDAHMQTLPGTYFSALNSNLNKIHNYSGKADLETKLSWVDLNFGGRFSFTRTDNNFSAYDKETGTTVLNTDQSNTFIYKEYNEALYFSLSRKFNSQWEAKLGLRAEATQTIGFSENRNQTDKNDYIKLFPTAYLTYTMNNNHSFSLNYNRRIRRPDFDYLNPFVVRTSPFYYSEGNPYLKPSIIDNLEFSYIKGQKWTSSLYYSKVSDFGQALSILNPETNVTRNTPMNYADTYQIGFSTSYNFSSVKWWNSFSGFNVNYQNVKSKVPYTASIDGYNAYLYSNNDFTLNKKKTVSLSVNYGLQLPGRYQIFHISTMNILDVTIKVLCLDKKFSVSLTGTDLLNSQRPLISYQSNGIDTNFRNNNYTRGFRLSLSYRFGNNDMKSKDRNFGNEEERNRMNQ
ncbi:outer membrane beta-barrel family protein [Chryseobacterium jejuense]|uniref:Outer membrane receptor for Fe3+-dicitrate n=1 Tax=Chryseobacterium jejuense TaxID=445960 RepID=A0A2X2X3N6_CHRJE|nr:outer membrane beta-barrel family protein [Chryseobacterium jejuense]SDI10257.1 Outer membrane receptor proteins, mostly Fe transport [Chryseobacterium jejuense]SQB47478.1 Outer membrane receptor for Fe3+-dicitrate [Chryseobacterium jejuense]